MSAPDFSRGTLIQCDGPTREFVLHLNETHNFLLQELDEKTLLIDESFSAMVQAELAKSLERHVFSTKDKEKAS